MGGLFYTTLITLFGIGVLGLEADWACENKQRSLSGQKVYIRQLERKLKWDIQLLEQTCSITVPDYPDEPGDLVDPTKRPHPHFPTIPPNENPTFPTRRPYPPIPTIPPNENPTSPTRRPYPPIPTIPPNENTASPSQRPYPPLPTIPPNDSSVSPSQRPYPPLPTIPPTENPDSPSERPYPETPTLRPFPTGKPPKNGEINIWIPSHLRPHFPPIIFPIGPPTTPPFIPPFIPPFSPPFIPPFSPPFIPPFTPPFIPPFSPPFNPPFYPPFPPPFNNHQTDIKFNRTSINITISNNKRPVPIHPLQPGGIVIEINPNFIYPWNSPQQILVDSKLRTVELIKKYGFKVETYFVTTKDEYILCLHRIPRPGAPVILLVHGLMSSSATWVQMGPNNGLAYILYMQGYDVWMLNTRGNIYSPDHKNPNIRPATYWRFSFHEIGIYDLPATIDLIIEKTSMQTMQFIGHSQGNTAFFAMCSELPHYCVKVTFMQALSPTVLLENTQSPVFRFLGLFNGKFSILVNLLGGFEISKNNKLIAQFREHICKGRQESAICSIFDFVTCGFGWTEFNTTLTSLIAGHSSQGASTTQIIHMAQQMHGSFTYYDKGAIFNRKTYGTSKPPAYNLTRVTTKVALHHADTDWLTANKDITNLKVRLPNVVDTNHIVHPDFNHYDFMISPSVKRLVYKRVIHNSHQHRVITVPQVNIVKSPPRVYAVKTRPRVYAVNTRPRMYAVNSSPSVYRINPAPQVYTVNSPRRVYAVNTRPRMYAVNSPSVYTVKSSSGLYSYG